MLADEVVGPKAGDVFDLVQIGSVEGGRPTESAVEVAAIPLEHLGELGLLDALLGQEAAQPARYGIGERFTIALKVVNGSHEHQFAR
ncbi:MAG: hypothetical protein KA226_07930 [Gemmatimonadales bacterium]|nr:hypothetical protein [Gemmatimonadales bacterium]